MPVVRNAKPGLGDHVLAMRQADAGGRKRGATRTPRGTVALGHAIDVSRVQEGAAGEQPVLRLLRRASLGTRTGRGAETARTRATTRRACGATSCGGTRRAAPAPGAPTAH